MNTIPVYPSVPHLNDDKHPRAILGQVVIRAINHGHDDFEPITGRVVCVSDYYAIVNWEKITKDRGAFTLYSEPFLGQGGAMIEDFDTYPNDEEIDAAFVRFRLEGHHV